MRQWLIIEMMAYYMQIIVLVILLASASDVKPSDSKEASTQDYELE